MGNPTVRHLDRVDEARKWGSMRQLKWFQVAPDLPLNRQERRGATRWDVVFVIGVLVALPVVLLPMLLKLRAGSKVTVCEANLRTIGASLSVQAINREDEGVWWHKSTSAEPIRYVGLMDYTLVQEGPRSRSISIEAYTEQAGKPPKDLSTSRLIWQSLLAAADPGTVSSPVGVTTFVCPGSSDVPARGEYIAGKWVQPKSLFDFGNWQTCSYGVQVPFGGVGRPGMQSPAKMAILADKGPWSRVAEISRQSPAGGKIPAKSQREWAQHNSPNHGAKGQNVYFGDGRVEYVSTPLAGVHGDNIYTAWRVDPNDSAFEIRTGYPPSLKYPRIQRGHSELCLK